MGRLISDGTTVFSRIRTGNISGIGFRDKLRTTKTEIGAIGGLNLDRVPLGFQGIDHIRPDRGLNGNLKPGKRLLARRICRRLRVLPPKLGPKRHLQMAL